MNAVVEVLRPGILTTVQDLGRWGWQSRGVSVSGAMDPFSLRLANALVGNRRQAAVLEITFSGPELRFYDTRTVALAGATFPLYVDDVEVPARHRVTVHAGSRVSFGPRTAGARAYLAVAGGVDVPAVLGSRATHVPTHIGGWHGRALAKGDRLPLGAAPAADRFPHVHALGMVPRLPSGVAMRLLPGPDRDSFPTDAYEALQADSYVVEINSDRTGFRLRGRALHSVGAVGTQLSDVTPIGALQLPPSGQPIVLMADRQTTGGYPKIATVITADIGVLGQAAPGDRLRFELCTMAQARQALLDMERPLMAIEAAQ